MPTPPHDGSPETVLITGASSGIGRATAIELAGRGAHLVLVARGREPLEEAAAEARAAGAADVVVCPADVLDEDAVRAAVDTAVERFGRLDAVVHAAQVMAYGRIEEVPPGHLLHAFRAGTGQPEGPSGVERPMPVL